MAFVARLSAGHFLLPCISEWLATAARWDGRARRDSFGTPWRLRGNALTVDWAPITITNTTGGKTGEAETSPAQHVTDTALYMRRPEPGWRKEASTAGPQPGGTPKICQNRRLFRIAVPRAA